MYRLLHEVFILHRIDSHFITNMVFIIHIFVYLYAGVMGYGAAEAAGLGPVCLVVINLCVLSANRVDLGFWFKFSHFTSPPSRFRLCYM